MKRIQGFIEAMSQLGTVMDVFVNANVLICFVWVAKNHLDAIDKLLDAYSQVGAAIPGLVVYQSAFEKYPPLAGILEDYYSDILQFHEAALEVFKRPRWKELLKSAWKNFDTDLQPILQSMKQRRDWLESEKLSASLFELATVREHISGLQEDIKQKTIRKKLENHKFCVSRIREKLQAPDYYVDQEVATENRGGSTSGAWVLQCQEFLEWNCQTTEVNGILYINGLPGAGKTTLVSAIIEKLLDEHSAIGGRCETLVAYFYFKHGQHGRNTHNDLLRAMLEQIITRDTTLSDHLSKLLNAVDEVNVRSTKTLESHIQSCLGDYRQCFIIVDGLDEAASDI
ncbi:hypothetical protein VPNG_09534 [Cytospora leucostoma]|uniref:NACHT domain-containing protein n=1 Tax=Cytospora leucostoma TaxID=1230097 RepID=A0A423VQF9_9PEZI|nr:hypothetical protein VPNG_09534 [Cytospora leucostoma]